MKLSNGLLGVTFAALSVATAAGAGTIYSNPYVFGSGGNCIFSTTCAATVGAGDVFAAQEFTLTSAAVITAASFTELDAGVTPTAVNWGFLLADGTGGLPGTILSAGADSFTSATILGTDIGYNVTQMNFGVGPQALGPGTYYFAIQAVSPTFYTFLGGGAATSGAATTTDGGATWAAGYPGGGGYSSVAVALYGAGGTVPEPASWALMLVGLGGLGVALRGRARKVLTTV